MADQFQDIEGKYDFYFNKASNEFDLSRPIKPGSYGERCIQDMLNSEEGKKRMTFDLYEEARGGDFSHFEKADPVMRNYLASQYMDNLEQTHPELGQDLPNQDLERLLEQEAMNPAFRLGCSLRSREDGPKQGNYSRYDDYMNAHIMEQTLAPVDGSQIRNLKEHGITGDRLDQTLEQNIEKQVMVARNLFTAHLGEARLKVKEPVNLKAGEVNLNPVKEVPLDRPVASMAAHCSRTAYVFPTGNSKQQDKLFEALTGPGKGDGAGLFRRAAATHSVSSGPTIQDFREEKKLSFLNQHGMNVAIGGLGNPGIGGPQGKRQMLNSDGSCGHMYMRIDKGNSGKCGSLLIGFESDAPRTMNQQGHRHDTKATPESMSSFLGQRTDEMGEKYGGRTVDCTGIPIDKMETALNEFSSHYRAMLIEGMKNPQARAGLGEINKNLCGNPMNAMELGNLMSRMGVEKEKAADIVNSSKRGSAVTANTLADPVHPLTPVEAQKKPGFFTRVKASLGRPEAKKACQDYKDYRNLIKDSVSALDRAPAGEEKKSGKQNPGKNSPAPEITGPGKEIAARLGKEVLSYNEHRKPVDSGKLAHEEGLKNPSPIR